MCGPFPVRMLAPTLMRFSMGNDTRAALAWTAAASSPLLIHAHAFSSGGGGGKKRDDDDVDDCFVPPSRGGETETSKDNNGAAETGSSVEELRAAHNPPSLRTAYSPSGIDLPESSFLKCIEKEITDEKLRLDKEDGPPPPPGWELSHTKGSSVFYGRRMWMPPPTPGGGFSGDRAAEEDAAAGAAGGSFPPRHQRCVEKHFIRVQLTTRDASLDPECDIRGEHFPFSFFVQRVPLSSSSSSSSSASSATAEAHVQRNPIHAPTFDDDEALSVFENSIEVRLDVVDGELVVDNVVYHGDHELLSPLNKTKLKPTLKTDDNDPFCNSKTHRVGLQERHGKKSGGGDGAAVVEYNSVFGGYPGPNLDEAEEDVLDGIQSWLAERAVDDGFGEFIGQYSVWVEQAEYEQWLQQLYDYIAA